MPRFWSFCWKPHNQRLLFFLEGRAPPTSCSGLNCLRIWTAENMDQSFFSLEDVTLSLYLHVILCWKDSFAWYSLKKGVMWNCLWTCGSKRKLGSKQRVGFCSLSKVNCGPANDAAFQQLAGGTVTNNLSLHFLATRIHIECGGPKGWRPQFPADSLLLPKSWYFPAILIAKKSSTMPNLTNFWHHNFPQISVQFGIFSTIEEKSQQVFQHSIGLIAISSGTTGPPLKTTYPAAFEPLSSVLKARNYSKIEKVFGLKRTEPLKRNTWWTFPVPPEAKRKFRKPFLVICFTALPDIIRTGTAWSRATSVLWRQSPSAEKNRTLCALALTIFAPSCTRWDEWFVSARGEQMHLCFSPN